MPTPRDPATDPRPGDVATSPDGRTFTVHSVDGSYVMLDDGFFRAPLTEWATWDPVESSDDEGGPFVDPPADAAPTPDDVLDVVERHARTLTALLTAAQIADDSRTPPWARGPAEAWLRVQFDALGGGGPAAPAERDPRTDPRPGDTKTWTDAYGDIITQTVTATDDGAVSVEEPYGPGASFDDLTLDGWAADHGGAVWACTTGGAS